MAKEYIEREALREVVNNLRWGRHLNKDAALNLMERAIDNLPTADVVERKRGEWIKVGESCGADILECPVCHTIHPQYGDAFCRDCGADMRQTEE